MKSDTRADGFIALGAHLTITEAPAFQLELLKQLDGADPLVIDGAAVERVDTAALQLLLAFVRTAQGAGRGVSWGGCSPALARAANRLGLENLLGLPVGEVGQ